jgi:uncharacterized protein YkwD
MVVKLARLFFRYFFAFAPMMVAAGNPGSEWNSAALNTASNTVYLNDFEKQIVLEINKLRSNPSRYAAEYLEPLISCYRGLDFNYPGDLTLRTSEGVAALRECIGYLKRSNPVPILVPSEGVTKAAEDHAYDQSTNGGTGHNGNDDSDLKDRIERYGEWHVRIAENISYGDISPRQVVIYLLIDDGVLSRGHRTTFLQKDLKVLGVAEASHPYYKRMCVIDFAGEFRKLAMR